MKVRRIFLWMGLFVLFVLFFLPADSRAQERYKVKKGDTLTGIAHRFNIDVRDLRKINKLTGETIRSNQVLLVSLKEDSRPKTRTQEAQATRNAVKSTYVVKSGDSLLAVSRKTGVSLSEIRRLNGLKRDKLLIGQRLILQQPAGNQETDLSSPGLPLHVDNSLRPDEEGDGEELLAEGWAEIERDKKGVSELLGKWTNPHEKDLLVRVTRGFLGAPYRFGGNNIRGIDCSAFVKTIYNIFGVDLPRTAREQSHIGLLVEKGSLQEGDLVFFNTRRPLGHVGIYIGNNEFIHASYRKKAVRIDNMDAPYFSRRFVRAVRLKGLDENI